MKNQKELQTWDISRSGVLDYLSLIQRVIGQI